MTDYTLSDEMSSTFETFFPAPKIMGGIFTDHSGYS